MNKNLYLVRIIVKHAGNFHLERMGDENPLETVMKARFSHKFKETVPKAEVLEQPRMKEKN
jgi:hypothetical protein